MRLSPALLVLLVVAAPALATETSAPLEPGLIASAHLLPADRITPGDVLWQAPVGASFALKDIIARGPVPDPGTPIAASLKGWLRATTAGTWGLRVKLDRSNTVLRSCTVRIALEDQDVVSGVIKDNGGAVLEGTVPLAEPGDFAFSGWVACFVGSELPRQINATPVAFEAKPPGAETWSPAPLFREPVPLPVGLKPGGRAASAAIAWTTVVRGVGANNAIGEELGRIGQPRPDTLELGEALGFHHEKVFGAVSEALQTVRKAGRWVYGVAVIGRPIGAGWRSNGCDVSLKVEDRQILADGPHRVAAADDLTIAQSYLAAGGADLVPGVYKLTVTTICAADPKGTPAVKVFVKGPGDAGLRSPAAGEITVSEQGR
jgi:hypothetical protein